MKYLLVFDDESGRFAIVDLIKRIVVGWYTDGDEAEKARRALEIQHFEATHCMVCGGLLDGGDRGDLLCWCPRDE